MKTHPFQWLAAGLLVIGLSACEREDVQPSDILQKAGSAQIPDYAAGATVLQVDLPALYHQAQRLDESEWLTLDAGIVPASFPVRQIRRSALVPRDAKAYTTNGHRITGELPVEVVGIEGRTESGEHAHFVLSAEHIDGYFEASRMSYHVQDRALMDPLAPTGSLLVKADAALSMEDAPQTNAKASPGTRNCWKVELLMACDYSYFQRAANLNPQAAILLLAAHARSADPAFNTINLDLVVPTYWVTTANSVLDSTLDSILVPLQDLSTNIYSNRDAILLVTGHNIISATNGLAEVGGAYQNGQICVSQGNSVAVCEWQRNGINGLSQTTCNARIAAHQIGHMLGANNTALGLMYGGSLFASPASSTFSGVSTAEMNQHIWFNHNCIQMDVCVTY
jgi:hypothetical protein